MSAELSAVRTFEIVLAEAAPLADAAPGGAAAAAAGAAGVPSAATAFIARVSVDPDDVRATGVFTSPFAPGEVDEALAWLEQGLFDDHHVRVFGERLFDALFASGGELRRAYDRIPADGRPLRFRLVVDPPAMARIPWELLYDRERQAFLALEQSVVRGLTVGTPAHPIEVAPPLRVLVATASPAGLPPVQGWQEAAGIGTALGGLRRRRHADVETLPHATLDAVRDRLRAAVKDGQPFHVFHFVGHGEHDPRTDAATLHFEPEAGAAGPDAGRVTPEQLADELAPHGVRLVFLNACDSARSSAIRVAAGFAPVLLRRGIPAVIGMQARVLDAVAVRFARELYEGVADGQPVDRALAAARRAIHRPGRRRVADVAIPVCYLRSRDGVVVRPPRGVPVEPAVPIAPAMPVARLGRLRWLTWSSVVTVAGLVLAAMQLGVETKDVQRLFWREPILGHFRVAVAEMNSDPPGLQPIASGRSAQVYRDLRMRLAALSATSDADGNGVAVGLMPPTTTGRISWLWPVDRLAEHTGANLVVYGSLMEAGGRTSVTPRFYLQDDGARDEEIRVSGEHAFGADITVPGNASNPFTLRDIDARIAPRNVSLVHFVIGLYAYWRGDFGEARSRFTSARTGDPGPESHTTIVDVFLGKTLMHLAGTAGTDQDADARLDEARAIFASVGDDPVAHLHLGELAFHRAHGACMDDPQTSAAPAGCTMPDGCAAPRPVDRTGLAEAAEWYRRAGAAPPGGLLNDVALKARFGLGRTLLCLSIAGEPRWDEVNRDLRAVIDAYEAGNRRVAVLAADAHAFVGVGEWVRSSATSEAYDAAIAAFARAVETVDDAPGTIDPARPAGYLLWQADLHRRQGDDAAHMAGQLLQNPDADPAAAREFLASAEAHYATARQLLASADARYATTSVARKSFECFRARVACEIAAETTR